MKINFSHRNNKIKINSLQKGFWWLLVTTIICAGCNKGVNPTALQTSPTGQLSRYDLTSSDYDVLPVTGFTASYDNSGKIINLFEKQGQTLYSFNLSYTNNNLVRSLASNLSIQSLSYGSNNKPFQINYTTITDTGKLVLSYDAMGKLVSLLDSVKKPLVLPIRYQYLYTYDAGGNNVVKIIKNQLDLQGRPTLRQYSFFSFDNQPNPFTAFPYLQSSSLLPGDFPALVNKNNVTGIQLVGTIYDTSSGGSVPVLDTTTIYRASRTYQYNAKGLPSKAAEKFNDIQFNYSGNRTFTYEY
jgi:hypothetical protein